MRLRFISFLCCLIIALVFLEVGMRVNGSFFHSLTDPLLLKAEILKRSPETNVLFIGTSRFVDGVDQGAFSEELSSQLGRPIQALNAAAVGSQGDRSAYIAEIAAANPGLTHVILEASPPALENGDLGFSLPGEGGEEIHKKANEEKKPFADQLEARLQDWFAERFAMVRYRKSLRPRTLLKIPVLLCSGFIDPNVWNRGGLIRNLLSPATEEISESDLKQFSLEMIGPEATPFSKSEVEWRDAREIAMLRRLSGIFSESEIKVIWVTTPIFEENVGFSDPEEYRRMFATVAKEYQVSFFDYSSRPVAADLRKDPTHLNAKGRRVFSRRLARDLVSEFETPNRGN